MRRLAFVVAAALAVPATAGADPDYTAVLAGPAWLGASATAPMGSGVGGSAGVAAEVRMLDDDEPFTCALGGFAVVGQAGGAVHRDVIDLHVQVGPRMPGKRWRGIAPYAALGLDVVHVTTHDEMGTTAGSTLGVSATGGLLGVIGERVVYRATVGYLGAIVPGSGQPLGGLTIQLGVGFVVGR